MSASFDKPPKQSLYPLGATPARKSPNCV